MPASIELFFTRKALFILSFASIWFSHIILHYIELFESVPGIIFGTSAWDGGLKIDMSVTWYGEQDRRPKISGSTTAFGMEMSDTNKLQHQLKGIDLNLGFGADLFVIRAVRIHNDSLLLPYYFEVYYSSTDQTLETVVTGPDIASTKKIHNLRNPYATKAWISHWRIRRRSSYLYKGKTIIMTWR